MDDTLEYLKDRYHEAQACFQHVEHKCAILLVFITLMIVATAVIASLEGELIFQPVSPVSWIALVSFLSALFTLVCAWGHALLALSLGECPALPANKKTAEYLCSTDAEAVSKHVLGCYLESIEKLTEVINSKVRNLDFAFEELTLSAWLLSLSTVLSVYLVFAE
ncbi:hypothetical protein [Zobellella maritima]|uniref:hypothetical protein n=1 Tax=Zobellella maritima TaxID=2059725 RepID=UPI000E3015A5|nr:hypothetical protein [Zobellella maritima]